MTIRVFSIRPDTKWLIVGIAVVAVCLPLACALVVADWVARK